MSRTPIQERPQIGKNQQPFSRKNLWLLVNLRDSPLTSTIRLAVTRRLTKILRKRVVQIFFFYVEPGTLAGAIKFRDPDPIEK